MMLESREELELENGIERGWEGFWLGSEVFPRGGF
jgi:hypothetical protein